MSEWGAHYLLFAPESSIIVKFLHGLYPLEMNKVAFHFQNATQFANFADWKLWRTN